MSSDYNFSVFCPFFSPSFAFRWQLYRVTSLYRQCFAFGWEFIHAFLAGGCDFLPLFVRRSCMHSMLFLVVWFAWFLPLCSVVIIPRELQSRSAFCLWTCDMNLPLKLCKRPSWVLPCIAWKLPIHRHHQIEYFLLSCSSLSLPSCMFKSFILSFSPIFFVFVFGIFALFVSCALI